MGLPPISILVGLLTFRVDHIGYTGSKGKETSALPELQGEDLKRVRRLPSGKGALLQREGLFSSQITEWRKIINQQSQEALSRKRGPKTNPLRAKVRELERKNERLRSELAKSRRVIEVQGKLSALLHWGDSCDYERAPIFRPAVQI